MKPRSTRGRRRTSCSARSVRNNARCSRCRRVWRRKTPAVAIAIMVGTVLLVLGGLFFFAARRPQDGWYGDLAPEVTPPAGEAPREAFPAQRARKLEKELADHRPLRNQVVREALVKGEHAAVARWVRELGEFLLDDLRGDSALAPALKAVTVEIAKPLDGAARAAALQDLQ